MTQNEIFEWAENRKGRKIRFNKEMEEEVRREFSFLREVFGEYIKNPIYIAAIKNRWTCFDDLPECESDLCNRKKTVTKKGKEFAKSCGDKRCVKRINFNNGGYKVDHVKVSKARAESMRNAMTSVTLEESRYKDHTFEEIQEVISTRTPLFFRNQEAYELLAKIKDLTSFLPEGIDREARVYAVRNGIRETPKCVVCGSPVSWTRRNYFPASCSLHCARKMTNYTFKSRNGVYAFEQTEAKKNLVAGYRDYISDENRVDAAMKKKRENAMKKYNRESSSQAHMSQEVYELLNDKDALEREYHAIGVYGIQEVYGINNQRVYTYLRKHGIKRTGQNRSFAEKMVEEYINDELGIETESSDRKILDGLEIDILIPSLGVGIEFDGIYWHSTKALPVEAARKIHRKKTEEARKQGIRLIHIFEDEWTDKREVVKKKLRSILCPPCEKIFARKTDVREVSPKEARIILEENHIQGAVGASVRMGLEYDGMLVAVMLFKDKGDGEWELNRYATSKTVVGGFSKLLKNFERLYKPRKIVSFADLRWSVGDVYLKNGFIHAYNTPPDYFYIKNNIRIRKNNFRRAKMEVMENFDFDPEESEFENTERNGYFRIYDCGLMKFVKEL